MRTSSRKSSCPRGFDSVSVMRRLLRPITFHHKDRPSFIGVQCRIESPTPGSSTLITSAPKSASCVAASGPAIMLPASITRMPTRGPLRGGVAVGAWEGDGESAFMESGGGWGGGRFFWTSGKWNFSVHF